MRFPPHPDHRSRIRMSKHRTDPGAEATREPKSWRAGPTRSASRRTQPAALSGNPCAACPARPRGLGPAIGAFAPQPRRRRPASRMAASRDGVTGREDRGVARPYLPRGGPPARASLPVSCSRTAASPESMAAMSARRLLIDVNRRRAPVCRCSTRPAACFSRGSVSALNWTTNALAYGRTGPSISRGRSAPRLRMEPSARVLGLPMVGAW